MNSGSVPVILLFAGMVVIWQLFCSYTPTGTQMNASNERPNFIVFFADDIGWGDIGPNWAPNIHVTPNLNKMAECGIRLTDFHSGSSICGPSRASLLTGRLGLRNGMISNLNPASIGGLALNETTLAEALKLAGYRTGMIGKWHLGNTGKYHPNERGFDYYYGLPYSNDMGCVDVHTYNYPISIPCPTLLKKKVTDSLKISAVPLYENADIVEQPVDLNQLGDHYAEKARNFLKSVISAEDEKPFFLYIAFAHMHVPLSYAPRFINSTEVNTVYSDTLHEMDDVIGRILQTLGDYGASSNTLIWFTGDNGPWQGKCQYSGNSGPFLGKWLTKTYGGGSTAKCTTWEGGHREPTVVMWPGHIPANTTSNALSSALDIFPTVLRLARAPLPKWRKYDGMDILSVLTGHNKTGHDILYHPNSGVTGKPGEIDTIRLGDYKLFWKTGGAGQTSKSCDGKIAPEVSHDPPLVFNVAKDPAESTPLSLDLDPMYSKIIEKALTQRAFIKADIKVDNTSVVDYSKADWAYPCCDSSKRLCRCKKDEELFPRVVLN